MFLFTQTIFCLFMHVGTHYSFVVIFSRNKPEPPCIKKCQGLLALNQSCGSLNQIYGIIMTFLCFYSSINDDDLHLLHGMITWTGSYINLCFQVCAIVYISSFWEHYTFTWYFFKAFSFSNGAHLPNKYAALLSKQCIGMFEDSLLIYDALAWCKTNS